MVLPKAKKQQNIFTFVASLHFLILFTVSDFFREAEKGDSFMEEILIRIYCAVDDYLQAYESYSEKYLV